MNRIQSRTLTLGMAAATALFLAGCGDGTHATVHDPDDHNHGTEHAGLDQDGAGHHAEGEDSDAVKTDVTGKLAETAGALAIIEKPTAEQLASARPYTLETCVVSEEELGAMGDPLVLVVGNQQVKLCCKDCLSELKEDTAKHLARLQQ